MKPDQTCIVKSVSYNNNQSKIKVLSIESMQWKPIVCPERLLMAANVLKKYTEPLIFQLYKVEAL